MPEPRAYLLTATYAAVLLTLHAVLTKGTGQIPTDIKQSFGADAGSLIPRWWAQFTAQFLHNSWGHITYNVAVVLATLPFAVQAHGSKTFLLIVLASAFAGYAVNLLIVLPLQSLWAPAGAVLHGRLIGASIAIFAGAGIAWTTWSAPAWLKTAALGGFLLYELLLTLLAVTGPFVGIYHAMGAFVGIGIGLALKAQPGS